MTRCDYDVVFYRVFCVTLLAVAFTFTVILTNVFVDIDGMLTRKKDTTQVSNEHIRNAFTTEAADNDDLNYGEGDDSYRTKRSIETQSFLFHIKNPKVKNILANRLSTLLEELEAEETSVIKPAEKKAIEEIPKVAEKPKMVEEEMKDKMLHMNMHNILLQGIEKHMDLNDVFKRMYSAIFNFNHDRKDGQKTKPIEIGKDTEDSNLQKPVEDKFFDEMLNCNQLQDQVQTTTLKPIKAPANVVIKTVIDITSVDNDKLKENDTKSSNENIQGDVELVYNGKVIKFVNSDTNTVKPALKKKIPVAYKPRRVTTEPTTTDDNNMIPKSYMNRFVEEYFKHFPHNTKENSEINGHFQTKRLKRHVRIKYENSREAKTNSKKNTEEDELYVEIETHFDSKGLKGEKKKKMIKSLIEKIQNAIHSDITKGKLTPSANNTKQHRSVQFRKRMQNPLAHNVSHILINKYSLPITNMVHRQQDPITKTVRIKQPMSPLIDTKSGEDWRKFNFGPGFLASGKAINSAELSQVNVDYSKILEINGIPQRLQQPLNTELSEETIKTNSYYDMGKMKFVIKDIDGSGFSVGFNQYVDEPPDPESMRLFAGLQNVIKTYHQAYDKAPEPSSTTQASLDDVEGPIEMPTNEHNIERRSINKQNDYHSNEYKNIFNKDFLKYKDYRDVYKGTKTKQHQRYIRRKNKKPPLILDENIFEKRLKPSEILSLANMFERKKRSINVKKMSNLNTRLKYNKFLNTNAMAKTIYLNTKRNKRQINKIRIIASDLPHMSKQSDENVYVVSDENVYADRAIIKEVESSEDHDKQEESEVFPYPSDEPAPYITKIFDGRSRRNPLMSKYPHIFMEEVSRSREQYTPNNGLLFGKLGFARSNSEPNIINNSDKLELEQFMSTTFNDTDPQKPLREHDFISSIIASPPNKSNYKVTVKIIPKNQTGINSGFKEIHTSINKSFNKNGLVYSSLVNVSEISKVVKLNKSRDDSVGDKKYTKQEETLLTRKIHDQQEKMQFLLKQHARHINEQLNRLNEEKMNLESLLNGENNTLLNSNALHMTMRRLELVKSADEALTSTMTSKVTTNMSSKPQEKAFQLTTTATTPAQALSLTDKIKSNNIITTIERNGNLTDQILKKIDKNTEILQMFLRKLTERIIIPPTAIPRIERVTKYENTYQPEWFNQPVAFTQNMVIRKNDSHISIPFTYAYQPPTSLPLKSKTQVASVVYQGHIRNAVVHRDMLHGGENENQIQKVPEAKYNQSRFFIDDLVNEYKVIQLKSPNELVYKVQEDKDGKSLTISSPNLKKSLREIIYYHIIEKPFGKIPDDSDDLSDEASPSGETPKPEEPQHVFTNGQEFQFPPESDEERIDLDFIKNLLSNVQGPLLVMGDFNGHHYRWGSDTCDNFGSGLADLMDELDLCVINNGCATRRGSTGQNSSCVDLTFCSSNIASIFNWNRLDMTYGSDHYPIMVEIPSKSSPNATSPPLLKYQLNLVDWDLYAKILDLRVSSLPLISGANAQECFTAFSNAISATADDCFPSKKPSSGKIPSPPWWDRECSAAIRARNEAEKQLNADMNLENLINFKHVLAKSRKLLKRKKREGWRRYCDSLSPSTPASVVWRKLKSFRNSMRSPSRSMTSKELGHQFFSKLAPAYAPNKDECAYPEFQLTSDEPLDEPFTSEELNSPVEPVEEIAVGPEVEHDKAWNNHEAGDVSPDAINGSDPAEISTDAAKEFAESLDKDDAENSPKTRTKREILETDEKPQEDLKRVVKRRSHHKAPDDTKISSFKVKVPQKEKSKNDLKQYGMELTGNKGTVWNNLNYPHISYHVGYYDSNEDSIESNSDSSSIEDSSSISSQSSSQSDSGSDESNSATDDLISGFVSEESPEILVSGESIQGGSGESDIPSSSTENSHGSDEDTSKVEDSSEVHSSAGDVSSGSGESNGESGQNDISGENGSNSGENDSNSRENDSHSGEYGSSSREHGSNSGESGSNSRENGSNSGENGRNSGEKSRENGSNSGEKGNKSGEHGSNSEKNSSETGDTDQKVVGNGGDKNDIIKKFGQILADLHDIFVKGNATIVLPKPEKDTANNVDVPGMLEQILSDVTSGNEVLRPGIEIDGDPNNPNMVNVLEGLFTKIIKNNIIINNNVPVSDQSGDINAEKDKIESTTTVKPKINEDRPSVTNPGKDEKENLTTSPPEENIHSNGKDESSNVNTPDEILPNKNEKENLIENTTSSPVESNNDDDLENTTDDYKIPDDHAKETEKPTTETNHDQSIESGDHDIPDEHTKETNVPTTETIKHDQSKETGDRENPDDHAKETDEPTTETIHYDHSKETVDHENPDEHMKESNEPTTETIHHDHSKESGDRESPDDHAKETNEPTTETNNHNLSKETCDHESPDERTKETDKSTTERNNHDQPEETGDHVNPDEHTKESDEGNHEPAIETPVEIHGNKEESQIPEDHTEAPKEVIKKPVEEVKEEKCPVKNKDNTEAEKNTKIDYALDLINNRTTKFIKEEIAAQVSKYFEEHPVINKEPAINAEKDTPTDDKDSNKSDKPDTENTKVTEPNSSQMDTDEPSKEKDALKPIRGENIGNENMNDETNMNELINHKDGQNELISKPTDEIVEPKHDEIITTEKPKKEPSVHVKANTVFGNTVGNDKVTNIYIFYASKNIDEIMKNIKNLVNGNNSTNIFTFAPHKPKPGPHKNKGNNEDVNEKHKTTELPKVTEEVTEPNHGDVTKETNIETDDHGVESSTEPNNYDNNVTRPSEESGSDDNRDTSSEGYTTETNNSDKAEEPNVTVETNTDSTPTTESQIELNKEVADDGDNSKHTGSDSDIIPEKDSKSKEREDHPDEDHSGEPKKNSGEINHEEPKVNSGEINHSEEPGEIDHSGEPKVNSGVIDHSGEPKVNSGERDHSGEPKVNSGEIDHSGEPTVNSGEKDHSGEPKVNSGEINHSGEPKVDSGEMNHSEEPKVNSGEGNNSEEPKVNSEEPKVNSEEPKVNSEKPKVNSGEVNNSAEPKVNPEEPKINPEEPKVNSGEVNTSEEPKVDSGEVNNSEEPKVNSGEVNNSAEPKVNPEEPKINPEEPKINPEEPKVNSGKVNTSEKPKVDSGEVNNSEEPKVNSEEPKVNSGEPKINSEEPKVNSGEENKSEEPKVNSGEVNDSKEPKVNPEDPKVNSEEPKFNSGEVNNSEEPKVNSGEVANSEEPKVNSEEPKVNSEEPKVNSEEPKVNSEEPKVNSEEPTVNSGKVNNSEEPKINSEEPIVNSEEPKINSEEPTVNSEEPKINSEEPTVKTEEPKINSEEPIVNSEEPIINSEEPIINSEEPIVNSEEPIINSEEPIINSEEPIINSEEPIVNSEEPIVNSEEPIVNSEEPIVNSEEPIVNSEEPIVNSEEPKINSGEVNNSEEPKVNSEEPKVDSEEPIVNSEEPIVNSEEPIVNSEEPKINSEEPIVNSEEPIINSEEPIINSEEPIVNSEEPIINSEEPIINSEEPIINSEEPIVNSEEPIVNSEEPIVNSEEPIVNSEEPIVNSEEPIVNSEEPKINSGEVNNSEEPKVNSEEPKVDSEEPIVNSEEPIVNSEEPIVNSEEPKINSEEPIVNTEEPIINSKEPIVNSEEPIINSEEPIVNTEEPIINSEEPIVNSEQPIVNSEDPTVNSEEPKINSGEVNNSEEPKVNSEGPKVNSEDPKVDSEEPKVNSGEVKNSDEPKVNSEGPKVNSEDPKVDSEEPKVNSGEVINSEEPKVNSEEPKVNSGEPKVNSGEKTASGERPASIETSKEKDASGENIASGDKGISSEPKDQSGEKNATEEKKASGEKDASGEPKSDSGEKGATDEIRPSGEIIASGEKVASGENITPELKDTSSDKDASS
ncbi:hypothetical protein PYW08_011006 [Mythimna loreyi]|uniref:Uncharacterized protein n=1 Tax=Mythimna loreyi TaxID=667449 RepID=A0ACC2Q2Y0_9NEOP|nr:hypothetical protein PYW08_011006 [Mythimna loreyi]